jgi:hypothetical protein
MLTNGRLAKSRREAIASIHKQQQEVREMLQRAKACGETPDAQFVAQIVQRLVEIEQSAASPTATADGLDVLVQDAEYQGQLSAYICPQREIPDEGALCLDEIEEWNVPKAVVDKLRSSLGTKIAASDQDVGSARSALRALFEEYDSWSNYADNYVDTMNGFALWLIAGTGLALLSAIVIIQLLPPAFIGGLAAAGLAGSFISVLAKMPAPDMAFSGELDAYLRRRILTRVAVGLAASLVGSALLGWGIISISVHGQSFADVVTSCTPAPASCGSLRVLVLIAIPLLFGFSERALTSLENKLFDK